MEQTNPANFRDFAYDCPIGEWQGRLEGKVWGKSSNILLYVVNLADEKRYRLSVFNTNGYKAYEGGPSFKDVDVGQALTLSTKKTTKGNPSLQKAELS